MSKKIFWSPKVRSFPKKDLEKAFQTVWFGRKTYLVRDQGTEKYNLISLSFIQRLRMLLHNFAKFLKFKKKNYFSQKLKKDVIHINKLSTLNKYTRESLAKKIFVFNETPQDISPNTPDAQESLKGNGIEGFVEQINSLFEKSNFPESFQMMNKSVKEALFTAFNKKALECAPSSTEIEIILSNLEKKWGKEEVLRFSRAYVGDFPLYKAVLGDCDNSEMGSYYSVLSPFISYIAKEYPLSDGNGNSPLYNFLAKEEVPQKLTINFVIDKTVNSQGIVWSSIIAGLGEKIVNEEGSSEKGLQKLLELFEGREGKAPFVKKSIKSTFRDSKYVGMSLIFSSMKDPGALFAFKNLIPKHRYIKLFRHVVGALAVTNDTERLKLFTEKLWQDKELAHDIFFDTKGYSRAIFFWSFRKKDILDQFLSSIPDSLKEKNAIADLLINGTRSILFGYKLEPRISKEDQKMLSNKHL